MASACKASPSSAGEGRPTSKPAEIAGDALAAHDAKWDPAIHGLWGKTSNNGYHTRFKPGSPAHSTRETLDYAIDLLGKDEPWRIARAEEILRVLLAMQVTDPTDANFGVWPWLMEEPVAQMAPPDFNWADFMGARLAVILTRYPRKLSPGVLTLTRAGLRNAAQCIYRRNVGPNYTNIAVMGGGVTAAAGELLDEPFFTEYGRARLQNCVAQFERDGGFNEYNSPSYTTIVLTESERVLSLVKDPGSRAAAEKLRFYAWRTMAESFHPATGQWAGPHSRNYSDFLPTGWARFLAEKTGAPIQPHPLAPGGGPGKELTYHDCPEELKARFAALPTPTYEIRRRFIRREPDALSTCGTTWMTAEACLGTANLDSFWIQRRPFIGYWRTSEDQAVVLKVRFLRDGNDFASAAIRTAQSGPDALSLITLLTDRGDHHDTLDRPKDGAFRASSLVARYELDGKSVSVGQTTATAFDLSAGNTAAHLVFGAGRFDGADVRVRQGSDAMHAYLDLVFYEGLEKAFRIADLSEAWAVVATQVQSRTLAAPLDRQIVISRTAGEITAEWAGLRVRASPRPLPYDPPVPTMTR